MSTQRKAAYSESMLSETAVQDYLRQHPDFFERHGALLGSLRLPHVPGGGAVSLVERQVSMLRQKDLKRERKLKELLEVARLNDALAAKIHRLSLALLGADGPAGTLGVIEEHLRTAFGADHSVLVLFGDGESFGAAGAGRFLRPIGRDDAALRPFSTFLGTSKPRCGQVRDSQRQFLFGIDEGEVGSAAMVPLGENCQTGFLAIGSTDAKRFHPGMSFDFLARIGELVTAALKRY